VRRVALLLLALAASLGGSDVAAAATPRLGQFVGKSDRTGIGVALGAKVSLAYACDGKHTGTWFKGGALEGRKLTLTAADSSRLKLRLDGKNLKARLPDRTKLARRTTLKAATGDAGLYRSENKDGSKTKLAGWVVQNSGKQVGTLATNNQLASAPKLSTTSLLAGSLVASPVVDASDPQPLVIDLGRDGINVTGTATTTALGGSARSVRWTVPGDDDAFVGVDAGILRARGFTVSGTGVLLVRGGLSVTRNGTSTTATDGLHLLRLIDGNRDGIINSADPAAAAVRTLTDANADGDFSDGADSIDELGEGSSLSLQVLMDRLSKSQTMLSNAQIAFAQTTTAVIRSLKAE
jgi:hypothetical protein